MIEAGLLRMTPFLPYTGEGLRDSVVQAEPIVPENGDVYVNSLFRVELHCSMTLSHHTQTLNNRGFPRMCILKSLKS